MSQDSKTINLEFLSMKDYEELKEAMIASYPGMPNSFWKEHQIKVLLQKFPKGQVVIKVNGKIAGCALSIIVNSTKFEEQHTYKEITGHFSFNTHTEKGDVLYGVDVFIKPEFRGLRLGRRLYNYRKELCEQLNLKAIVFGGRIPNYHKFASECSPKEYLEKVKNLEIHDPVLNYQLSNDFRPVRVIKGYLEGDEASNEYAVLLRWDNIYYEKPNIKAKTIKKVVRLGIVQWQMRPYNDLESLLLQIEYFVDALSGYKCDFALFPEFFNAPLMAKFNHLNEAEAIRKLAEFTPKNCDRIYQTRNFLQHQHHQWKCP
jgi:GNAT superfamily N-acetyltransferase